MELAAVEAAILHLPLVTADMIRVQLLTGARPGEVCKMRPWDIDRTSDFWEYHVGGHKTEHHGQDCTVYIGPEAQAVLTPYLLRESQVVDATSFTGEAESLMFNVNDNFRKPDARRIA